MHPYIYFGDYCINSYGLMMSVGVLLSSLIILLRANHMGIGNEEMIIVISASLGGALLGAGLLYIIVSYSVNEIINYLLSGNFDFLKNGGMVFYGGLIGGILCAVPAARWQKLDINNVENCVVPVLPLGHGIGRIGCLCAGCCYGVEYYGPFAVKNLLLSSEKTYFPIQAVETLFNLLIFAFLSWYARKKRPTYHILCTYLIFYSILRFIVEFYRGDLIRGAFGLFSTSQWISIAVFSASVLMLIFGRKHKIIKQ